MMSIERASVAFTSPLSVPGKHAKPSLSAHRSKKLVCVTAPPRPEEKRRQRGNGGRGSRTKLPEHMKTARMERIQSDQPKPPQALLERRTRETSEQHRERIMKNLSAKREALAASFDPKTRRTVPRHNAMALSDLQLGSKCVGIVQNLVRHGAYVDIGAVTDGLVHIRDMSVQFVYSPEDLVQSGQQVTVWIKYVDPIKRVLGLTMVPPAKPVAYDQRVPVKALEVGKRYQGIIARVTNYGVYVDLGAERQGFLHVSALWGRRPRQTLESIRLGRPIWVHVDEIDEVRSFVRLRARGLRPDEPLDDKGPVGALHKSPEIHAIPNETDASGAAPKPKVDPRFVLQRFGEDLDLSADQEDEDDQSEEYDEDGHYAVDEDEDEDDDEEEEEEDDEYELDYNDEIVSRIHPVNEAAEYGFLNDDAYGDNDKHDDSIGDDENADGDRDYDIESEYVDEVWVESDLRSRKYVDSLSARDC